MKTESFILLFCLLSICFTQDSENQCETQFLYKLRTECQNLGSSCTFNTEDMLCLPISSCSGKSSDNCPKTIPSNYHYKKCEYDSGNSSCNEVNKVCSDYNKAVDGNVISEDICSSLTKETDKGDRCYYSYPDGDLGSERSCSTHYNSCGSINSLSDKSQTKCEANIPSDLTKKCSWNSESQCVETNRTCTEYKYLENGWADKDNCNKLEASDASNGASCVYYLNRCTEAYPCSHWDNTNRATCERQTPLNDAGDDYDYLYRCKYDTSEKKCEKVRKTCDEYNDSSLKRGNTLCSQFSPEDSTNKTCVYISSSGSCIEQYKTCQLYDENDAEKSRAECEGLKFNDPNTKCVYIKEEHKCEEGNVYNNCNEYKGSDRKICERILSPKRNSYCVLDKDSVCKERDFFCVEAYDRYDCLIYAKPTDDTKKCVWDWVYSKCKEEYKGCEDYVEKRSDIETTCGDLEVYNGKKCYYNSDKCTSKNKKCDQAKSREECKLIEKTGVSDPDRKYCEWYSTSETGSYCRENYKYCSDYRPTTSYSDSNIESTCGDIKPFNPETNTLDLAYKCAVKDSKVGCEKVPKDCTDAGTNQILCDLISPLIKDNRIKYCAFIQGSCVEHYKTCELVDESRLTNYNNANLLCDQNIPERHYFVGICEHYTLNSKYKCRTKTTSFCNLFNTDAYQDLCLSINPNCTYSYGYCYNITKSCTGIQFYTQDDNNKAICEAIKPSNEDKICVLKEDKSGCEEIYRESIPFIYADNANSNSNSAFKLNANGMQIILILLSLLF